MKDIAKLPSIKMKIDIPSIVGQCWFFPSVGTSLRLGTIELYKPLSPVALIWFYYEHD